MAPVQPERHAAEDVYGLRRGALEDPPGSRSTPPAACGWPTPAPKGPWSSSSGAPVEGTEASGNRAEGVSPVAFTGMGTCSPWSKTAWTRAAKKIPCHHLVEYSSEGRQPAMSWLAISAMRKVMGERFHSKVVVKEASGKVDVTDGLKNGLGVGPPLAAVVDRELTAEVRPPKLSWARSLNPGGIETNYRFEYGPTSAYGSSTPFPEGSVGEGVVSHAVWAAASGLAPGTTYHYRVVARTNWERPMDPIGRSPR